ncbi:MAG: hypothetical protein KC457_33905, partial [Myxococcales bacterium]|nr:hypothetical protein [Myxococcales bacterium]
PLPDFELLIDKGRFDALRDFDHIVIASPDIRDWTQTFLAVDYRVSREEVKLAIERAVAANGEVIEWVDDGGFLRGNPRPRDPEQEDADNRWFVFLEGKIAIYVREEFLPSIMAGPAGDDRKTTGEFVANLAKVRRFAARQPDAGMQLVLKDIRRNLKRSTLPFKIPDEFEISASAAEDPEVVVRGTFVDVVEAKAFIKWWTEELGKQIAQSFTLKLQVGWVYDLFELERDGKTVTLRAQLTSGQAQKIMQFAADGSRKVAKKTPEEIEEMKRRRLEAMKARKGGKLPPSALDPNPQTQPKPKPQPDEAVETPSPAPSTPDADTVQPVKPTKTPPEDGKGGNVPG